MELSAKFSFNKNIWMAICEAAAEVGTSYTNDKWNECKCWNERSVLAEFVPQTAKLPSLDKAKQFTGLQYRFWRNPSDQMKYKVPILIATIISRIYSPLNFTRNVSYYFLWLTEEVCALHIQDLTQKPILGCWNIIKLLNSSTSSTTSYSSWRCSLER